MSIFDGGDRSLSARYERLAAVRQPSLDRARDSARLTIPALLPPDGHNGGRLPQPWQSVGARGINNLSAKLLLALLPTQTPFFQLVIDDFGLERLTRQRGMRAKVDEALNRIERAVLTEIETSQTRAAVSEAMKQLITAGNVLLHLPDEGGIRYFKLDRYVVRRDPLGAVLEIITCEDVAIESLPDDLKALLKDPAATGAVPLHTRIALDGDSWRIDQELNGAAVPGDGAYPKGKCPWIALRWTKVDGEDYGRGHVEEYFGDLRSLDVLNQAITEGSAAAARVVVLVNPNGVTMLDDVAEAENGAVVHGRMEDVTVLRLDKSGDLAIAMQLADKLERRVSMAFLVNGAVQRSAERVTAEEIRYMAGELEDTLGGVYTILSQELQLPLALRLMARMERQGRLPALPDGVIKPAVKTGLEALGRGHDLQRLTMLVQALQGLGPQAFGLIVVTDLVKRIGTALGIDMAGLVKSDEQLQAEQQAAQQQAAMAQMLDRLGPKGMDMLRDQMNPVNQPEQGAA